MTPKAKALRLMTDFIRATIGFPTLSNKQAKQCALMAVMEQLEEHSCQTLNSERHKYWTEVKAEIKKL